MATRILARSSCSSIFPFMFHLESNPVQKTRSFSHFSDVCHLREQLSLREAESSLASLLQRYGFPKSHVAVFLRKNRFLLGFSLSDVEKSLGILSSFKLSQESLVSVLSSFPRVLELGFMRRWEDFFSKSWISDVRPVMIQNIIEQCESVRIDPAVFCQNVEILKKAPCSDKTLARVLDEFPSVVAVNPNTVKGSIQFLRRSGIREDEVDWVICSFPGILGFPVEDRWKPLFAEFEALGFQRDEVRSAIMYNPRVLNFEMGEISWCVHLLRNLKCRHPIQEKIFSKGFLRAAYELKLRVDFLCRHGLILREASKVLQREPRAILYGLEDIEKKLHYLLHEMGFNISCLNDVPEYLGVNLDKTIVPRYRVIRYLESKGALGYELGLNDLVKASKLRFYNLFVKPYSECEKIFGGLSREVEVKSRHPAGLWKMFTPRRDPKSEEDFRNIRSFMKKLG